MRLEVNQAECGQTEEKTEAGLLEAENLELTKTKHRRVIEEMIEEEEDLETLDHRLMKDTMKIIEEKLRILIKMKEESFLEDKEESIGDKEEIIEDKEEIIEDKEEIIEDKEEIIEEKEGVIGGILEKEEIIEKIEKAIQASMLIIKKIGSTREGVTEMKSLETEVLIEMIENNIEVTEVLGIMSLIEEIDHAEELPGGIKITLVLVKIEATD